MSKQLSNVSQKENIHRRAQWISRFLVKQETKLSPKNLQLLYDYNDDMIIHSMAENTRYKNLTHFGILTKMLHKDWIDVTEKDLRTIISQLMINHGENGKETGYTFGLKISVKSIVRFVKLGSRNKPEDGELEMIKFIKLKKPKDKLTREDLPTDEEIQKILSACADSSRDKAMISVHAEAGTRVGELLGLKIKVFNEQIRLALLEINKQRSLVSGEQKGLTASELVEILEKTNTTIDRQRLQETILKPLVDHGYLEKARDESNKTRDIYYLPQRFIEKQASFESALIDVSTIDTTCIDSYVNQYLKQRFDDREITLEDEKGNSISLEELLTLLYSIDIKYRQNRRESDNNDLSNNKGCGIGDESL